MTPAAAEELRLLQAASRIEVAGALPRLGRLPTSERFQMALWSHRDAIVQLIDDADRHDRALDALRVALFPFAQAAQLVKPGDTSVLISLARHPGDGRHFIQIRASDFTRASAALQEHRS